MKIYELIASDSDKSEQMLEMISEFEETLTFYQKSDFQQAEKAFKFVNKKYDDPLSKIYADRCLEHSKSPHP